MEMGRYSAMAWRGGLCRGLRAERKARGGGGEKAVLRTEDTDGLGEARKEGWGLREARKEGWGL